MLKIENLRDTQGDPEFRIGICVCARNFVITLYSVKEYMNRTHTHILTPISIDCARKPCAYHICIKECEFVSVKPIAPSKVGYNLALYFLFS